MKNYEQYKRIVKFTFSMIVLSLEMITYKFFWLTYYNKEMLIPYKRTGNWLIVAVYGSLLVIFNIMYGGLKIGALKNANIIYSQTLASLCANAMIYLQITLLTKHFQSVTPLLAMTVIEFLTICIWSTISTRCYYHLYPPRNVLLIYGEHPVTKLMGKLHTRTDRFIIGDCIHISEGIHKITKKIDFYDGVIICDLPSHTRNLILKYCYGKSIRTYMTPKISDILTRSSESLHLFDTPLLLSRNTGFTFEQKILKRSMDIVLSSIGLIFLSPLFLLITIGIKMEDKGPVIYKQKRLTIGGREFYVYKFRSMRVDAEQDGVARLACVNDNRVTVVGNFIRKVRLDELPQLFNILKGDMSIVGPRPERPEIAQQYEKEMPEFQYRLRVKAGLTGYAQIYGKYNTTPYDKLKLDLHYIQNYSLLLDIMLIFLTTKILFMKESTEGVTDHQVTAIHVISDEYSDIAEKF